MNRLLLGLGVGLLIFLHLILHLGMGLGERAPDLLVVALLLAVREMRVGWGALLGFGLGLSEDAFSLLAFGSNTLAFSILGAVGARTRDFFVGESLLFMASYLLIGAWVRTLLQWVLVGGVLRAPFVDAVILHGIPTALYSALIGLMVAFLAGGVSPRKGGWL